MLDRKCLSNESAIRNLLTYDYGPGFFHKISANVNVPDNCVLKSGHKATLRHEDARTSLTTTEFYFIDQALQDAEGKTISPLHGIESDALAHDLRLEETVANSCEVRFLFGWARLEGDDDARCPTTMEFFVADSPAETRVIQSIIAICRVQTGPDDNWRDSVDWEAHYWGKSPKHPAPRLYLQLNVTNDAGEHFTLLWYRLGVRMPELDAHGKLLWSEEHLKYDDFRSFVESRSPYVLMICERLIQRREAGADTNVPLDVLFSVVDLCVNINRRIADLRAHEGLQDLESYVVGGKVMQQYLTLPQSNKTYTVAQVERRISEFEQLADLRETYSICFAQMEKRIKGVCGCLRIDNVRFAEISIPARHSLPGEKVMEVHQFAYTPQGVKEAYVWLTKEKVAFDEGVDFIREHFHLKLGDDDLFRSTDDEVKN